MKFVVASIRVEGQPLKPSSPASSDKLGDVAEEMPGYAWTAPTSAVGRMRRCGRVEKAER